MNASPPENLPPAAPADPDEARPAGGDAEPAAAPADPDEAAPAASAASAASRRRALVPWLVALLMACVAILFATLWAPLYQESRAREQVREAATELVLHLTTFEGAGIEEWVARTQAMATGEYAEQVAALFDQNLRDALRDAEAESVGALVNLFVQDVTGDRATVFAVARQTIRNAATDTPVEDELRIQVELVRQDGGWRAANVEVLGPSGAAPPVAPRPGPDQDDPGQADPNGPGQDEGGA